MDFEFVIPVSRDDLLNKTEVNQFVVDEILTLREVVGAIQGIEILINMKTDKNIYNL